MQCSYKLLTDLIDRHPVISFDIFDTLLMRRTWYAEDVFDLVGYKAAREGINIPSFRELRLKAQDALGLTNPNIYDIYDSFVNITGVTEAVRNRLIELEFEIEKEVLIPRNSMVDMLKYALTMKKAVYLISDMYLPTEFLTELLKNLNGGVGEIIHVKLKEGL